ncbi:MAG: T9SS type A sorting domain-containing protein, partial [Bacteroidia bacterium]
LKIEDKNDPTRSVQTEAIHTVANGWETLVFDFANEQAGTAALNLGFTFDKATIFFNWAQTGAQAGAKTYYFDDVEMGGSVGGLTQMDLPVTFDDATVDYGIVGFEGAEGSIITTDPTDPTNTVVEFNKSETAQFYAGVTVTTLSDDIPPFGNGFATAIPITAENTTMTVRTWSPDAGIIVVLKIEDKNDPTRSVQTEAIHTVANGWETLVFDFANEQAGTAALNLGFTFDKATIFFNWAQTGAQAGAKTYYFDDVEFGGETTGGGTFDITFQVNMNSVTEPFTTPEVNGTFNGFCGGCAPMSDIDLDGIWTLTIPLEAGTYEYKYAADTWNIQETLADGLPCTSTIDGFVNRTITVSEDVVLDAVCWGTCDICNEGVEVFDVTFQVDMNDVTDAFTTPELNGTFNGFCGSCAPMSDANSDGVWEITIPLAAGMYEYKFSYDTFAGQETLVPGTSCTMTTGQFTNRVLDLSSDSTLAVVCWGSCVSCEAVVPQQDVTFQVDMNQVDFAFTTPELFGSFNGFCSGCNPLTDDNSDGIWTITLPLFPGTYEYKFAYDNLAGQETLVDGSACTSTIDGFTNRTITVDEMPITIDLVCWESCFECEVGFNSLANANSVQLYPNPAGNTLFIKGLSNAEGVSNVSIFNAIGSLVYSGQIQGDKLPSLDLSGLANGVYFVEVIQNNNTVTKKLIVQH